MNSSWPLLVSLLLNAILAVVVFRSEQTRQSSVSSPVEVVTTAVSLPVTETNPVAPAYSRPSSPWQQVASADLSAYVANLRRMGCPEATLQVIIAAELDEVYRQRLREETADTRFWKTGAQEEFERNRRIQRRIALNREKERRFADLVGIDWWEVERSDRDDDLGGVGSALAFLEEEKALRVARLCRKLDGLGDELEARADRLFTVEEAQTREEIAAAFLAELRQMLTPEEFEEFELRCSTVSVFDVWSLEDQFGCTMTGPELREFLKITREQRPLGAFLADNPFAEKSRLSPEAQALEDARVRELLGEERFKRYLEACRTGPSRRSPR